MADVIDNSETDGCELDFTKDPDDDETASLRPLFPDGDPSKAPEWEEVFKMTEQESTPEEQEAPETPSEAPVAPVEAPEGPNSPRLPGSPVSPSEAPEEDEERESEDSPEEE